MARLPCHKNLVRYYASKTREIPRANEVLILMELCPGGSLPDIIAARTEAKSPLS